MTLWYTSHVIRRALLLVAAAHLLGCPGFGDEEFQNVPDFPTYDPHVKAILDARCIECHMVPPQNGAPTGFRLDQYDDDGLNVGAGGVGCEIKNRAVDRNPSQMPPVPRDVLDPSETETVRRWVEQGRKNILTDAPLAPCP